MRKFFALAVSLLVIAGFGFCGTFAIKLGSGLGYISGGDFAKGIRGWSDYYAAEYNSLRGEFLAPRSGMNLGGEVIYYFKPNMGLGLGVGYARYAKDSEASYDLGYASSTEQFKAKISVIPITANFHYLLPLLPKLTLDLTAGVSYNIAKLSWDYMRDFTLLGYSGTDQFTYSATRGGIGLQAGAGAEYELSSAISVVLNVTARYASIAKFQGDWTERGSGNIWDFSDSGSETYAWYFDWKFNETTYPQIVFQNEKPTGTTVSNARYARLGLTGLVATLGIKIGLPL
ncbi:MAG: outer membrane beta-barrel protein [Candidatus Aminicenantes bacterium]|nr:outer membrane beta-barrel protein [Candidatus Aminicenantes bacterium]